MTIFVALAFVATAAVIGYYLTGTTTVDTGVVLQYSEDDATWENAEDLVKSYELTNFVGDDVDNQEFYLLCNANLDNAFEVTFTLADESVDDPEGININVTYFDGADWVSIIDWDATDGGSTTGTYTFDPGDDINFKMTFTGDIYLMEGEHSFELLTEATEKL